jgi:hypothetical protein
MQRAIGKASRLTSPEVCKSLKEFYGDMMCLDKDLVNLLRNDSKDEECIRYIAKLHPHMEQN